MPRSALLRPALLLLLLAVPAAASVAQSTNTTSTATGANARILGTVSAISGNVITVHPEGANADVSVTITPQTRLLRTAPGQTSLKDAQPLQLSDLAAGDRVLIRQAPGTDADHPVAGILVAMKQGDIAQVHQQEAEDWQKRGVSGIVATLDTASGTITLRPQSGAPAIAVHTIATTVVRHYAPASTSFADTHKITLAEVHPGDQLRARGAKDASGAEVVAEEIVVGSFRNIAGTVLASDPAANTLSVTDLATKRPVTIHLEANTQLRKLPPEMAARLARRANGAGSAGGDGASTGASAAGGAPERPRGGDTAALLQRAPTITLADLKKGDAVMIVASGPDAPETIAITLIAGVEPLLEASPEASAGLFSASWNLGGGAEGAAQQ